MIASINDHRAILDPLSTDKLRLAHCPYDNVRTADMIFQALRLGMADGNGRIGIEQHQRHRLAQNGAAPDDYGMFARQGNLVGFQQAHDPFWSGAAISRLTHCHAAKAETSDTVDIFIQRYSVKASPLINLCRYRVL